MARILIAGCGFVGLAAARLFYRGGYDVVGLVSSEESASRLSQERFPVEACDLTSRTALQKFAGKFDAVVHCASPGGTGSGPAEYRHIYLEGIQALSEVIAPKKLLFTSSTSVYAQDSGEWVTEESATEPDRETGRILLEAEQVALSRNGWVARLAGIYGPGRSVYLRRFLDGTARVEGDGERFVNQIHRDDAAGAIFYLIAWHCAPGIYNVVDDEPTQQIELYRWMADYFARPIPPFGEVDLNRKRGVTNKRVSNEKLHTQGWRSRYPSFREAISEIVPGIVVPGRAANVLRTPVAIPA